MDNQRKSESDGQIQESLTKRNITIAKCSLQIAKKTAGFTYNERTYDTTKMCLDGHIDEKRFSKNVVLIKGDLDKFFSENFEEAIKKFNEKNKAKHPDRITSCKKYRKQHVKDMQEAIIQIGDHDTYTHLVETLGQDKADDLYIKYLTSAFERWKERYPNFKPICAAIHMDEVKNGTPHLHLDFIPVAHSKRGLETKVSLEGALSEFGYVRTKNGKFSERPYTRWLTDCRKDFEEFAQAFCQKEKLGIQILPSEKCTRPHEDIQTYRVRERNKENIKPILKEFMSGDEKRREELAQTIIDNARAVQDVFFENNKTIEKQIRQKEFELSELQKALNEQLQMVERDKAEITKIKQELEEEQKELELKTIDLVKGKEKV